MEQYFMPRVLDFKNLRLCLDAYQTDSLYIRLVGAKGGDVKVNETLEGRTLDFRKDPSGLYFLIDSKEVFHFPLKDVGVRANDGFTLAYERIEKINGQERLVMLGTGIDPYDANLPEPRRSFLRNIIDDHLVEIYFKGRVHLKFHSWFQEPHWKYWVIDKPCP